MHCGLLLILLPLAAFAEERICGTRWLETQRQSLPAPAAKTLEARQEDAPIEVGTQLPFFVPTDPLLNLATCRYKGEHCYIFVEESQWDILVAQPDVDKLGELFDRSTPADPERGMYDLAVEAFGPPPDRDGDPRVFILVLDIPDDRVVGYFDRSVYKHVQKTLRRDTVYLDARKLVFEAYLGRGTLAHEFQHLIHWGHDEDEEAWVDEGLAGYAEELTGFPETDPSMVPSFLDNTDRDLTRWPFPAAPESYGKTYLFASFLAERYGPELIRRVVAEPRNGIFGIDEAFKDDNWVQDYAGAWSEWIAANYAADDPDYGYRALRGRRAFAFSAPVLPFDPIGGRVNNPWGTTNVIIRAAGGRENIEVDFAGSADGRYAVWAYAMRGGSGEMIAVELDGANAGRVRAPGVDSLAVIVGRTSLAGGDFTLAARSSIAPTAVAAGAGAVPEATALDPVYPNPFNHSVVLPFRLARAAAAELAIYNALGQRVALLLSQRLGAGNYRARWNGDNAASGPYTAVLKADGVVRSRHLTLVK